MNLKFKSLVANSATQTAAIDELRLMFRHFIGKSVGEDNVNPSITHSALENQESRGVNVVDAAGVVPISRKKVQPVGASLDKKAPRTVPPNAGEVKTVEPPISAPIEGMELPSDTDNVVPRIPGQQLRHPRSHDKSLAVVNEVPEVDEKKDAGNEDIYNFSLELMPSKEKLTVEIAEHGSGGSPHSNFCEAKNASKIGTPEGDVGKDTDVVEGPPSTAVEDAAPVHSKKPTEPDVAIVEGTPKNGQKTAKSPTKVIAALDVHVQRVCVLSVTFTGSPSLTGCLCVQGKL